MRGNFKSSTRASASPKGLWLPARGNASVRPEARQGSPVRCRRCPRNCKGEARSFLPLMPLGGGAGKAERACDPEPGDLLAHQTFTLASSGGGGGDLGPTRDFSVL